MTKRGAGSHRKWYRIQFFVKTNDLPGLNGRVLGAIEKDEHVDDYRAYETKDNR